MTIHRYLDVLGQGGNHTTWWLFKALTEAGWTVAMSGSGTGGLFATSNVFDMSQLPKQGDIVDPNGIGIGSEPWGHPGCWFVVDDPSANRQILLKRFGPYGAGSYDTWWTYRYSRGSRFGEGQTPSLDWNENTPPAAPDEATEWDTTGLFSPGGEATRCFIAADDTPSPSGEYGFIAVEFRATNAFKGIIVYDDVRECPDGLKDCVTVWAGDANDIGTGNFLGGNGSPGSLYYRDTIFEDWNINTYYCGWYGYNRYAAPNGGQVSADGKEYILPIPVVSKEPSVYVGFSRWFRVPSINHSYPDTGGGELYMFNGNVVIVDLLDGLTTPTPI